METVKEAARCIPHRRRGRFLEALCDRLVPVNVISDEDVQNATRIVLTHMRVVA